MDLSPFPRRRYTIGATPLELLERLSEELGGPEIYMKRDDQLGLAAGGNKTRKLEFLVADALARGCGGLITCGAVQSNHCRLTAAAAAREGLECHLVLEERVAGSYRPDGTGNNFLYHLLGVTSITVVPAATDLNAALEELRAEHELDRRHSYVIPGGGSNALGALGYVACANEVVEQEFEMGIHFDAIICASGSAGTHAGLLAGLVPRGGSPVIGVSVRYPSVQQEERVHRLASDTLDLLRWSGQLPREAVTVLDGYVGEGYSLPTAEMVEAVRLLARLEGILLDPVYTGKAMAGLIDQARAGRWSSTDRVLFVHTGGSPALYAYQDVLDSLPAGA